VPVLFDFQGLAPTDLPDARREHLWCLLPGRAEQFAVLVALSRKDFVAAASSSAQLLPAHEIVAVVGQQLRQQQGKDILVMVKEIETKMQWLRRQEQRRRQTTRRL
jgi:hypothetical protein